MKKAVDKVPETRQNTVNRIMPHINVSVGGNAKC